MAAVSGPVVVEAPVELGKLSGEIAAIVVGDVESTLYRGRQKTQHDRRKGDEQRNALTQHLPGFGRSKFFRQTAMHKEAKGGACAHDREDNHGMDKLLHRDRLRRELAHGLGTTRSGSRFAADQLS